MVRFCDFCHLVILQISTLLSPLPFPHPCTRPLLCTHSGCNNYPRITCSYYSCASPPHANLASRHLEPHLLIRKYEIWGEGMCGSKGQNDNASVSESEACWFPPLGVLPKERTKPFLPQLHPSLHWSMWKRRGKCLIHHWRCFKHLTVGRCRTRSADMSESWLAGMYT